MVSTKRYEHKMHTRTESGRVPLTTSAVLVFHLYSHQIAAELDSRCHRGGHTDRGYSQGSSRRLCRGWRRQSQVDGRPLRSPPARTGQTRVAFPDDQPVRQPLSAIPEDDARNENAAACAAAVERVAGSHAQETQSDICSEAEQQPIQRDEEGVRRRRDCTLMCSKSHL